jgi:nicotinamidase-related amidase
MKTNEISLRKTGLLFFDMLNVYFHGASEERKQRMRPVVANAVRLLEAARNASIPVVYAKANHRPDGKIRSRVITDTDMQLRPWPDALCDARVHAATEGSWEADIIPELKPEPQDTIIPKYRWSAFHQTYLDLALRARGVDTLILSGGAVEVGIASTAYAARDLDYHLIVARDACSDAASAPFDVFMERVFPKMARVRTTDQILEMIATGSR